MKNHSSTRPAAAGPPAAPFRGDISHPASRSPPEPPPAPAPPAAEPLLSEPAPAGRLCPSSPPGLLTKGSRLGNAAPQTSVPLSGCPAPPAALPGSSTSGPSRLPSSRPLRPPEAAPDTRTKPAPGWRLSRPAPTYLPARLGSARLGWAGRSPP